MNSTIRHDERGWWVDLPGWGPRGPYHTEENARAAIPVLEASAVEWEREHRPQAPSEAISENRARLSDAEREVVRWAVALVENKLQLTEGLSDASKITLQTAQADAVSTYLRAAVDARRAAIEALQESCPHANAQPCSNPLPGEVELYCDDCGATWLETEEGRSDE